MVTDEQLVEDSLAGSALAFSQLVERYQERLLRYLVTRSGNRADAEDAVQDTFISAYRYLYSYNPRWAFSTWIYRIAIRNAARQTNREVSDFVEVVDEDASDPLEECIEFLRTGERLANRETTPESGCLCRDVAPVRGRYVDQRGCKGDGQNAVMDQGHPVTRPPFPELRARRKCNGSRTERKLWTNLRPD